MAPPLLRVSQLNALAARKLRSWKEVFVEGEISDLSRPRSGHLYFKLNDERAQIQVVMYATDAVATRADMRNGEQIRVRGRFSIYTPRGALQLTVFHAEPAGEGDKRAQLEKLRKKLAEEGLFDPSRKRPLPLYPRVVGLVTSQAGAALHDVLRVAAARAPVRWIVSHCQVQGPDAPVSIVVALRALYRFEGLSAVIVTRGGGASEDLSAFNDERVARAIAACPVPLVSGIGHEVDLTIADLVADVRAATPSNAAELVVPDAASLRRTLDEHVRRLQQAQRNRIGASRLGLERLERRLSDPRRALGGVRGRFTESSVQLERVIRRGLRGRRERLTLLAERLARHDPRAQLARDRLRFDALAARLRRAGGALVDSPRRRHGDLVARLDELMAPRLDREGRRLSELAARLNALSPLAVLSRGYAIALHEPTGRALLEANAAAVGDLLTIRLSHGSLSTQVRAVQSEEDA